jgi:hypothetical protein
VRLGGDVSALAWTSQHRVVALVGRSVCCPEKLRVVAASVKSRRVVRRRRIAGVVLHIARWRRGLVPLTGPKDAIGPASLAVVDRRGVRATRLTSISAGEIPGGGVSEWHLPGLAVDTDGRNAYVVDLGGSVAEINLRMLAVSGYQPTTRRSFLARLAGWLQPTASAKGDSGPVRDAEWIGQGFVLVSGSNLSDSEGQPASDPAGLELIDTHNWTASVLAPQADSFIVVDELVLATGACWRSSSNPTGMGLEAYGSDRQRRFGPFNGQDVWVDHVTNGRAYVGGYGWKDERVVDLSTGRMVGTRTAPPAPTLLLGLGNPLRIRHGSGLKPCAVQANRDVVPFEGSMTETRGHRPPS